MRKISFALFLFFLIPNGYSQKKPCSDFKTGKFEYTNPQFSEWKVTRTDSTQTEISSKNGMELKATIIWKSDCEYVLTYEKTTNLSRKDLIGKKVFVEIFDIQDQKFKYHAKLDIMEMTSEMIKVE